MYDTTKPALFLKSSFEHERAAHWGDDPNPRRTRQHMEKIAASSYKSKFLAATDRIQELEEENSNLIQELEKLQDKVDNLQNRLNNQ